MTNQPQMLLPWGNQPHSEMQCRELLYPHIELCATAYHNCIGRWEQIHDDTRRDISAMQRGGVLHDLVTAEVKRLLRDDPQPSHAAIEVCDRQFFKLYVGDTVVLRFKKLPHDHVVRLRGQRPNTKRYYGGYAMPEVRSHCTRVTCGYVSDSDGTLLDVVFACQSGEFPEWSYSILHEQPATGAGTGALPDEADIVVAGHDEHDENTDAGVA